MMPSCDTNERGRQEVLRAVRAAGGDFACAARDLGVAPAHIHRLVFTLGISAEAQRVGHEARQLATLRETCAVALERVDHQTPARHVRAGGYPALAASALIRRRAQQAGQAGQAWRRAADLLSALARAQRPTTGAELIDWSISGPARGVGQPEGSAAAE